MKSIKKLIIIVCLLLGVNTIIHAIEASIGTTITYGIPYEKVKVKGKYTYLLGGYTLTILDTTNTSTPMTLGDFHHDNQLYEIDVVGNYAYILGSDALLIVDITDPTAPVLISENTAMFGHKIDVLGNYAYVLSEGIMKTIDITIPSNPIIIDEYYTGANAQLEDKRIIISDEYAYILMSAYGYQSKVYTVKIDDINDIRAWGEYTYSNRARDMSISINKSNMNKYIYLLVPEGIKVLEQNSISRDISQVGYNSYNITIQGGVPVYTGTPREIDIIGNKAYVTDGVHGLLIFDISAASNPTLLYRDNVWNALSGIDVTFTHVYVIKPNYGLQIIDTSVLSNVHLDSNYLGLYNVKSIAANGSHIYVGDDYGLKVVDVSIQDSPKIINAHFNDGDISHILIKENDAYISVKSGNTRLLQLDISNPLDIFSISSRDQSIMSILHTQVVDNHAYCLRPTGVIIYDLAQSASIDFIGEYIPLKRPHGFTIVGKYMYVLSSGTLDIVDISNPLNPLLEYSLNVPTDAIDIKKDAYFVYITGKNILEIYNTSNPRYPVHVSSGYSLDTSLGTNLIDSYFYAKRYLETDATGSELGGVTAINVTDSSQPLVVSRYRLPSIALDMDIAGNYAYIANDNRGMSSIKIKMIDTDHDGVPDINDAFPLDASETLDTDKDGIGNNADRDDDGDGVPDINDAFPLDQTEWIDTDSDGVGNNADSDDDGDDIKDIEDAFPLDSNESVDTDGDGIGNNADMDDDGDNYSDTIEQTEGSNPLDASSTPLDTDGDFIPNSTDIDDDNDGISDADEVTLGFNPLDASDGLADTDGDGFSNAMEFSVGTNMNDANDTPIWTPIIMGDIMIFVPAKAG